MFYRTKVGTEGHDGLVRFFAACADARKQVKDFMKKHGVVEWRSDGFLIVGRPVGYSKFDLEADMSPFKWSKKSACWVPDKKTPAGRAFIEESRLLPSIGHNNLADYGFQFDSFMGAGRLYLIPYFFYSPTISAAIYVKYPDGYTGIIPDFLEEVLGSEYNNVLLQHRSIKSESDANEQ